MKILIIYAHPSTNGHCSTILKEVQTNLDSRNIEYEIIDLYKIKYDPILHENEHYTAGNFHITKQNREIQEIIKKEILGFCGIKSKVYKIGNATELTSKQMQKIKAVVKKGLHYIYN